MGNWWGDAHAVAAPKTVIFLSFRAKNAFLKVEPVVMTSSTRMIGREVECALRS
jgi:hypothetical protein